MLKISLNPRIDTKGMSLTSFDSDRIVVKDTESGQIAEWASSHKIPNHNSYTAEQRDQIFRVNAILEENLFRSMTEAEIEFFLYPFGKPEKVDPEEYQILAGFEVKKEIKYK
jgi:hypothetical protein